MLKSVLYWLLLLTTTFRLADIVYLVSKGDSHLPITVMVLTCLMVVYGGYLAIRKQISSVRMKQFLAFYVIQTAVILFNIFFVAITSPFSHTFAETVVVGTFLDIIINVALVYMISRQMRSFSFSVPQSVGAGESSMNV